MYENQNSYLINSLVDRVSKRMEEVNLKESTAIDKALFTNTVRPPLDTIESEIDTSRTSLNKEDVNKLFEKRIDHEFVLKVANVIADQIYERDPNQKETVINMANVREIEPTVLLKNKCFFSRNVGYMEDLFIDQKVFMEDLHISTATNTLWKDRFIIPVRDFKNNVYGFVGYSKFSQVKYVEWSAPTYAMTTIKALGLNNIKNILESRYCIFTEGVFDYFRGHLHNFSIIGNLGVNFNTFLKPLIDRLDIVFTAYDNDETGRMNSDVIDGLHPYVYHIQFKSKMDELGNPIKVDLDEALKNEDNILKLKEEIYLRLRFKNIMHPKTILI